MPPLNVEGNTLAETHRLFNERVDKAIKDGMLPEKLNPGDSDLDNLLKIDIASKQKNVDYILDALKSEDMLYVSRAIKQSIWLVTDRQFANIINPEYLHKSLFPQMTTKASHKLMLQIRLHLNDHDRAEDFYRYIKDNDLSTALKWLPLCSLPFIETEAKEHAKLIPNNIFKKLCERSFSVFKIMVENGSDWYDRKKKFEIAMFLLSAYTEKYFDALNIKDIHTYTYMLPNFNHKGTDIIMKKCPQTVFENFEKFAECIHLPTFAKHLKREEIKDFLLKLIANNNLTHWLTLDNIKELVQRMPKEGKFEFIREFFIERSFKDSVNRMRRIYRWYTFAPFEVAFKEIKNMIRSESSPAERNAMLAVIVSCAKGDSQHIRDLLQYYHDRHINEPFKFKIQFIRNIISQTDTHRYDKNTWNILNTIFYSLEVYNDHDNNVQNCVEAVIAYNILHNAKVPEIIENKFKFNSMKKLRNKLEAEEETKIFNYLYNIQITKIHNHSVTSKSHFNDKVQLIQDMMTLISDWDRHLSNYPAIVDNIKGLIKIKKEHNWDLCLSSFYIKKWRRLLFEDSLSLSASEKTLINVLKHDPKMLLSNKSEVDSLRYNDKVSLIHLFYKLRVYFPESITNAWTEEYLGSLATPKGYEAVTRALCVLLPRKELQPILEKYAPTDTKINWSEDNKLLLSFRKHFAKNMHLARPLVSPEIVLHYARGDYLQFALPSLTAITYNLSSLRSRDVLPKLLQAPVSVQKHGLKLAFDKLHPEEIKKVFSDLWKTNKNATIRAVLFKHTYKLMCKQNDDIQVQEIWELLKMFIENLSLEEDKTIYRILSKVYSVPLVVRGQFLMKSYNYLSSLPPKANCENTAQQVLDYSKNIMEHIDFDFITEVIKKSLADFTKKGYFRSEILTPYLLDVRDEESQSRRYEEVLLPLLDQALPLWNEKVDNSYIFAENIANVLRELRLNIQHYALEKKMVLPVKMFANITKKLEENLPIHVGYTLKRTWGLTTILLEHLDAHNDKLIALQVDKIGTDYNPQDDNEWNEFDKSVVEEFSQACIKHLKKDIDDYFPSITIQFGKAFKNLFIFSNQSVYIAVLKGILDSSDQCPQCYVMVLYGMPPSHFWRHDVKDKAEELLKQIESHPSMEVKMHYYSKKNDHY